MSTTAVILSALFASSVLAAPTSSSLGELERRADWQTGKCEAHIALNTSNRLEVANPTSKWEVNIIDNPGNQIGNWAGTNPADIYISTSKGHNFVIDGEPSGGNLASQSYQDSLTLTYNAQIWNGIDCYRYIQKSARPSNGWRHQYDWWCQFDC